MFQVTNEQLSALAMKRMKENPTQPFLNKNSRLFCDACKMVVRVDKTSVSRHIIGRKHKQKMKSFTPSVITDYRPYLKEMDAQLAEKGIV